MAEQGFAFIVLVALVVAIVAVRLHRDLRRAVAHAADRRLGGWWVDIHTGEVGRSQYIKYGTAYLGAFSALSRIPSPSLLFSEDDEWNRRWQADERVALSVIRPEQAVKVGGVL